MDSPDLHDGTLSPGMGERPLRIALVAPPYYEVPPRSYGGIEYVCFVLAEGLAARGHDVTVFGAGPRRTSARFVQTFAEAQPEGTNSEIEIEIQHAARVMAGVASLGVDIVHDHSRLGPLTAGARRAPTLVTVHSPVSGPESRCDTLLALGRSVGLVAVSDAQRRQAPALHWLATVHNGIPVGEFLMETAKGDDVVYLGALSPNKGVHLAIDAAKRAGRRLVIAGTWTNPAEESYFRTEIHPHLDDTIVWAGEVTFAQKQALLATAACLIVPSIWEEPFGLVIVEALACGTPVVGLRTGAIPELVSEGRTGVICDGADQLPGGIAEAVRLSPRACREHALRYFDASRMVDGYETLYRTVIERAVSG